MKTSILILIILFSTQLFAATEAQLEGFYQRLCNKVDDLPPDAVGDEPLLKQREIMERFFVNPEEGIEEVVGPDGVIPNGGYFEKVLFCSLINHIKKPMLQKGCFDLDDQPINVGPALQFCGKLAEGTTVTIEDE